MLPAPVTPLLMVLMTPVFFAGAGAILFSSALAVLLFTTVDALLSLDSLIPLILRALAVAAPLVVPVAGVVPGFLLLVPVAELAVVDALAFPRFPAMSFLVDRAFSAQLLKRFDALLCFTGDFDIPAAFSGAGATRMTGGLPPGVVRGRDRRLVEAGERTLDALVVSASAAGLPRAFFLDASEPAAAPSFSLLLPEISSLNTLMPVRTQEEWVNTNLVLLGGLLGPGRDAVVERDFVDAEETERDRDLSVSGTGGRRVDCSTENEGVGLTCCGCWPRLCLSARSPIFAFLNDMGMRLTRISIRVRRPCAWRLYCARSFRARSVTTNALEPSSPPWA